MTPRTLLRIAYLALRNRLQEELRYPFQFILNYLFFVTLSYFLAVGGVAVQGGGSVLSNMASFFLAFALGGGLNGALDIYGSNRARVEEFYIRPIDSVSYLFAVFLGRMIETMTTMSIFLLLTALLLGQSPEILVRFIAVGTPLFVVFVAVGMGLAGIRLIFQKVGVLSQLIWILLLGTSLAASTSSLSSLALWSAFANGVVYLRGGPLELNSFICSCVITAGVGLLVFKICERAMFKRGLSSQE